MYVHPGVLLNMYGSCSCRHVQVCMNVCTNTRVNYLYTCVATCARVRVPHTTYIYIVCSSSTYVVLGERVLKLKLKWFVFLVQYPFLVLQVPCTAVHV